jgi:SAM-dependent methyltransferase
VTDCGHSPISFRDPAAALVQAEERLFRLVRPQAAAQFAAMLEKPSVKRRMNAGSIVRTWPVAGRARPPTLAGLDGVVFEHERIPFVSAPCEWTPEMLAAAGKLTLEIGSELLGDGLQLKDATPGNVLFRGPEPVFVDVASIVPREPGSCLWIARHQFETTFLLPLIASAEAGLPLAWTLSHAPTGLPHELLARILGWRRWARPKLIASVALPAALASGFVARADGRREMRSKSDRQALFTLRRLFRGLTRTLDRWAAAVHSSGSHWHGYTSARTHYQATDLEAKKAFVAAVIEELGPGTVLDVGANTGEFSELAASKARVVALDADERSVSAIFERARDKRLPILPLVGNFGRPTPGLGWRNREVPSFLDRAHGRFDLVLLLAVVHHLRVTEGIPLDALFEEVAAIARGHVIVEFVPVSDPMFRALARGRESLYADCSRPGFEEALSRRFSITRSTDLPNGRALFLGRRRAETG